MLVGVGRYEHKGQNGSRAVWDTNAKWLKTGTPVATRPGAWCYTSQCWDWLVWCQSAVTGSDSKSDLQLLSQCRSMYNCLGRSIPEIH